MARPKGPLRPAPEDFAEQAALAGYNALKARYGVGIEVLRRWYRETGGNPRSTLKHTRIQVPADFATVAPTMTITALQKHYGVSERPVKRWIKETGVTTCRIGNRTPQRHKKDLPSDFRELAPTMTYRAICAHYSVSKQVLSRWLSETGVRTLYADAPKAEIARAARQPRPTNGFVFRGHASTPLARDLRQITMFDQAADVLRRERFVVYRCGPTGKYLPDGLSWRVGNTIITPDELLQRAAKYERHAA